MPASQQEVVCEGSWQRVSEASVTVDGETIGTDRSWAVGAAVRRALAMVDAHADRMLAKIPKLCASLATTPAR